MAGKAHGELVFSRVAVDEYIASLEKYKPDILSLSEVHMEGYSPPNW
jgi:ferric-dicitrate binding protein FerR (iron transport regulator)